MKVVPPIPEELWQQVPPAAQAALLAVLQHYEQRLAALQQQIDDLQQRLGQNSTNSSLPPSTDAPTVKRAPPRPASGRARGGQPGHPLQQRPLLPPDRLIACQPTACRRCGQALHGVDPEPLRHQVLELPPIRPDVTEYQLHRLRCPGCGTSTCGQLPAGVPQGQTGPRLQAVLALLTGAYRLSKRQVEALCADVLGVPLSPGQICQLEHETADTLDPVLAEIRAYVRTQPANMDETSWRQDRHKAWLWVTVTTYLTLFHIGASRGSKVAKELVGRYYDEVLTTDRYSAYSWLPLRKRQLCWAHLQRDFQAMVDRQNAGSAIGEELLVWAEAVFNWWYRVRDGTLSRASFRTYIGQIRPCFRELLEEGSVCACAKTAATCRELLKVEAALWTFARVEGVEPTNNAAERALRHAVQWRKTSYGTDSAAGSHFVANILSVVATCRQQGRHVLDYLTQACEATLQGLKPPSLLPQTNG
jgi:transposase